jgi:hypothetical protein
MLDGGFIKIANVIGIDRIQILNIKALYEDDKGNDVSYITPNDHLTVGMYMNASNTVVGLF